MDEWQGGTAPVLPQPLAFHKSPFRFAPKDGTATVCQALLLRDPLICYLGPQEAKIHSMVEGSNNSNGRWTETCLVRPHVVILRWTDRTSDLLGGCGVHHIQTRGTR